MGSNPVGDASGGQRQGRGDRRQKEERTDLAQRYRVILKMLLKRWVNPCFSEAFYKCRSLTISKLKYKSSRSIRRLGTFRRKGK